jgi:hypothetical protein
VIGSVIMVVEKWMRENNNAIDLEVTTARIQWNGQTVVSCLVFQFKRR